MSSCSSASRSASHVNKKLWRECATRYLLPHLPDGWGVKGKFLYLRPNDWIVCAVHPNRYPGANWFKVERLVQLLVRPADHANGPLYQTLIHRESGGVPALPDTSDTAGRVMTEVLESIRHELCRFFSIAREPSTEYWTSFKDPARNHRSIPTILNYCAICMRFERCRRDDTDGRPRTDFSSGTRTGPLQSHTPAGEEGQPVSRIKSRRRTESHAGLGKRNLGENQQEVAQINRE